MFMALLLMYLKELRSVLGLIGFMSSNPEWLRTLGLKRRVNGVEVYSVPDRTRFYRLARRIGIDGMMRIISVMVVRLMQRGVKARSVSLDAIIISAWFKDCRIRNDEQHLKRCRHEKTKDTDASWGYDLHRDKYVYGYKIHVLLDSKTALPIALTVTASGYGENRTVPWFVSMLLVRGVRVRKFFADMGYDSNRTRLLIAQKLRATPFISLLARNAKGSTPEEKTEVLQTQVEEFSILLSDVFNTDATNAPRLMFVFKGALYYLYTFTDDPTFWELYNLLLEFTRKSAGEITDLLGRSDVEPEVIHETIEAISKLPKDAFMPFINRRRLFSVAGFNGIPVARNKRCDIRNSLYPSFWKRLLAARLRMGHLRLVRHDGVYAKDDADGEAFLSEVHGHTPDCTLGDGHAD